MRRTIFALLLLSSLGFSYLNAQYVIEYPYLFYPSSYTPYTLPSVGFAYFSLPRPSEHYQSIRLRGLSDGFDGLIRDQFSDHFRNPANRVNDVPMEIFGDLGNVAQSGKFKLGSFVDGGSGSLGGFVNLDRLSKTTRTTNSNHFYSSSTSSNSDVNENSYENSGGRVSYSFTTPGSQNIGASYEYLNSQTKYKSAQEYIYTSQSYNNYENTTSKNTQDGNTHIFDIGAAVHDEKSTLELHGKGILGSFTLESTYNHNSKSGSSQPISSSRTLTDVKSTGGLISGIWGYAPTEKTLMRFLAEVGYTSYTTDGNYVSSYNSGDTSATYRSTSQTNSSSTSDGSIIDLKVGSGFQKQFSEKVTGYFAASVNYYKNAYDMTRSESSASKYGSSATSNSTSTSGTSEISGFDIRVPLGVEYFIGDYVVFRGGVEPRYRSGKTSNEDQLTSSYNVFSTQSTSEIKERGLNFAANLGATFHHNDYGEVNLLFTTTEPYSSQVLYYGYGSPIYIYNVDNLMSVAYWSFSVRYFL